MTGIPPFFFSAPHPPPFPLSYDLSSFAQIIPPLQPPFMGHRREAFMGHRTDPFMGYSGDLCMGRSSDPCIVPERRE